MKNDTSRLRDISRSIAAHWTYDRRIRWFAWIDSRWVPMTPLVKAWASMDECHTYRAQARLEVLGIRVRRAGRKLSRKWQRRFRRRIIAV